MCTVAVRLLCEGGMKHSIHMRVTENHCNSTARFVNWLQYLRSAQPIGDIGRNRHVTEPLDLVVGDKLLQRLRECQQIEKQVTTVTMNDKVLLLSFSQNIQLTCRVTNTCLHLSAHMT